MAKTPIVAQKKYTVLSEYTWSASYLQRLVNLFRKQLKSAYQYLQW